MLLGEECCEWEGVAHADQKESCVGPSVYSRLMGLISALLLGVQVRDLLCFHFFADQRTCYCYRSFLGESGKLCVSLLCAIQEAGACNGF